MKLEIIVPETWEEIKLSQYTAYTKALKPYQGVEDFEKVRIEKAMSHFCNINSETISKLPMENYNGIAAYIYELFQQGQELPLVKNFVIGDTKYGFMPSMDSMTYGEYLDLSTYSKDMWDNIALIMSILYRPITKEDKDGYEIQAYNGTDENVVELFKTALTMDIVWGAIGFFTLLQKDLLVGIMTYSVESLEKLKTNSQLLETLITNGVDISVLQSSQEMISQGLTLLQDSTSTNA
jgi:hypothetical protein